MHLFHIPQRIIQNWNVHIFVLNGALWEMSSRIVWFVNEVIPSPPGAPFTNMF